MRKNAQKYLHCVGYAGSGKTTLVDALERNFPEYILSATRYYTNSSRFKRLSARILAARYLPKIIRFVLESRPQNLRAARKLFRSFFKHYRKLECARSNPIPFVIFDEGIPHKIRALRSFSTNSIAFSDLSFPSRAFLSNQVDCIIVVKPPVDVWRLRLEIRGLKTNDRETDVTRYEESMEKTFHDIRAIQELNPQMHYFLTESVGDVDAEASRVIKRLLELFK